MRRERRETKANLKKPEPVSVPSAPEQMRRMDRRCTLALLVLTLLVYAPALFGGNVLLPADTVPLMRPWSVVAREKFPEFRSTQNQMLGPIFEYYSWRHYARERILQGEVPLWNPNELSGNVLLGNSQSAVLYPPNVLLYLLPLWVGINLVTALHTFLTGWFLFRLLRALHLHPAAAMTGAVVWMFCGLQTVWTEFQTPTAVLCWLPGLLWAWERFRQRTAEQSAGLRSVLLCGGAIALILLAGHLHFAFYCLIAFGLYAAIPLIVERARFRMWGVLFACFMLGGLLAMAALLPTLEMGRMNFRGATTEYAASIALRLPPANLLTLLQPNLLGNPRDYQESHGYTGTFDFIEYTAYLGIPALILALSAVFCRRVEKEAGDEKRSAKIVFGIVALTGLLLALGTPLCALFFYGVPGYRQFNATARALCLFSFGLAALSAFGVETLLSAGESIRRQVGWAAGLATALVVVLGLIAFPGMGLVWQSLFTDRWFSYLVGGLLHFLAFALLTGIGIALLLKARSSVKIAAFLPWVLPVLAAADLLLWGRGFNPMTPPGMLDYPTATTDYLRQQTATRPDRMLSLETPERGIKSFIVPNYNAVVGLREVQGADSLHARRYHRFMEQVVRQMRPEQAIAFPDPNTIHLPKANHLVLDMLNVRFVTAFPDVPLDTALFKSVRRAELDIWENPRAYGEGWVVRQTESVPDLDAVVRRLSASEFDPHRTALLERTEPLTGQPTTYSLPGSLSGAENGQADVSLRAFAPHRLTYEVTTDQPGLFVMSEPSFPGWRATRDGNEVPLLTAYALLRALPLPAGTHRVEVRYEPVSYRVGLYLSVLAAGFCAGGVAVLRRKSAL